MTKKVLVVDDDPDVRSFVVTVLEENQYAPLVAEDGVEGLEKIKKEAPDLVVLDVLMPRSSGIRLYRTLKTEDEFKNHSRGYVYGDLPSVVFEIPENCSKSSRGRRFRNRKSTLRNPWNRTSWPTPLKK